MPAPIKPTTRSGTYVRELRERLDLSQTQFAELIGYQQAQVSRIETGSGPLSPSFAFALAVHTDARLDDLANLVSQKRPLLDAVMLGAPFHTLTPLAAY